MTNRNKALLLSIVGLVSMLIGTFSESIWMFCIGGFVIIAGALTLQSDINEENSIKVKKLENKLKRIKNKSKGK